MNSEKTPFAKSKGSGQKKAASIKEKGKRKIRSADENASKAKSSKKKLNFGSEQQNTEIPEDYYNEVGVRRLPDTSGPAANLRSKRRLNFTLEETKAYNEDLKKLRQQYRDKVGPNWRDFVRCLGDSSDEDEQAMKKHPLPPGASGRMQQ